MRYYFQRAEGMQDQIEVHTCQTADQDREVCCSEVSVSAEQIENTGLQPMKADSTL